MNLFIFNQAVSDSVRPRIYAESIPICSVKYKKDVDIIVAMVM